MHRISSRGNTAIAALLLVTVVGIGAIVLDATVAKNTREQLAQASTAAQTKVVGDDEGSVGQVCQIGFDYVVKVDTSKTGEGGKVSTTLNGGKTALPAGQGNQCPTGVAMSQGRANAPQRSCTQAWSCQVFLCTPIDLLSSSDQNKLSAEEKQAKEKCTLRKSCTVGQPCGTDKLYTDELQAPVERVLRDDKATPEQQQAARSIVSTFPSSVSSGILSALRTDVDNAEAALQSAEKAQANAQQNMVSQCPSGEPASIDCEAAASRVVEAQAKVDQAYQYHSNLAQQAQSLSGQQSQLAPTVDLADQRYRECVSVSNDPAECYNLKYTSTQTNTTINNPCEKNPSLPQCGSSRTPSSPGGGLSSLFGSGSGGLGNSLGSLLGLAKSALSLFGGSGNAPTCKLTVSPANITQPGQTVTLSWTSQGAQQAQLSNVGSVGPSGSMQVQPQQTTTYSMQVIGYPQQQQQMNPYGQQQGQYVWNPQLNAYVYVQAQAPYGAQPQQSAPQYGNCQVQVTVGAQQNPSTPVAEKPVAQISCQPKLVEPGMEVALSFACQNASVSAGSGFSTNGALSGNTTVEALAPTLGSNTQTYGITCSKEGVVDSAQCTVQVNKSAIVLVANPKEISKGETSNIGWVTGGMDKCTISSDTLSNFTSENEDNTSPSGVAKTPALNSSARFTLNCLTKTGGTKSASVNVNVQ